MGSGTKRPISGCSGSDGCQDGQAIKASLLAVVAMVAGGDGSIYVGDFNIVRKIGADGTVKSLLEFG